MNTSEATLLATKLNFSFSQTRRFLAYCLTHQRQPCIAFSEVLSAETEAAKTLADSAVAIVENDALDTIKRGKLLDETLTSIKKYCEAALLGRSVTSRSLLNKDEKIFVFDSLFYPDSSEASSTTYDFFVSLQRTYKMTRKEAITFIFDVGLSFTFWTGYDKDQGQAFRTEFKITTNSRIIKL